MFFTCLDLIKETEKTFGKTVSLLILPMYLLSLLYFIPFGILFDVCQLLLSVCYITAKKIIAMYEESKESL